MQRRKHTRLVPQVRCLEPGCGRSMYRLNVTDSLVTYGCAAGHMRKLPRQQSQPGQTHNNQPPDAA